MFESDGVKLKHRDKLIGVIEKGKSDVYSDLDIRVVDEYLAKEAQKGKYEFCVGLMPDHQSYILEVCGFESEMAREAMRLIQKKSLEDLGLKVGEKTFTQLTNEQISNIDDDVERRGVVALAKSSLDQRRKSSKYIAKDEPSYFHNTIKGYLFGLREGMNISAIIRMAVKDTTREIQERKKVMSGEGKADFEQDERLKELSERLVDIVKLRTQQTINPPVSLKPATQVK